MEAGLRDLLLPGMEVKARIFKVSACTKCIIFNLLMVFKVRLFFCIERKGLQSRG
jgi:hypothetical protein